MESLAGGVCFSTAAKGATVRGRLILSSTMLLVLATCAGAYAFLTRREPQEPTEIYRGITYGCERIESSPGGSGLIHWVRVDLTAPGISLYVTPLDADAVAEGWQYRLERPAA